MNPDKMPKLSIITVNLNNAAGLKKTIESVVNQTFTDYEYIIIDGGSTDGSVEVIKEFSDKITTWVSEPDKGIYNAMNKGILKSTGEYLQFLNSGDWLVDEDVLRAIFLKNRSEDILYGDLILVDEKGYEKILSYKDIAINLQFFFKNSLPHPASFIKRELFNIGLYDENYKIVSDWKFFLFKIVIESCKIFYLDRNVANYDLMGISSNSAMQALHQKEKQEILRSTFPPLVFSDIEELIDLKIQDPVIHILEIKKYKVLRYPIYGFIRIILRGYQKILLWLGFQV